MAITYRQRFNPGEQPAVKYVYGFDCRDTAGQAKIDLGMRLLAELDARTIIRKKISGYPLENSGRWSDQQTFMDIVSTDRIGNLDHLHLEFGARYFSNPDDRGSLSEAYVIITPDEGADDEEVELFKVSPLVKRINALLTEYEFKPRTGMEIELTPRPADESWS